MWPGGELDLLFFRKEWPPHEKVMFTFRPGVFANGNFFRPGILIPFLKLGFPRRRIRVDAQMGSYPARPFDSFPLGP